MERELGMDGKTSNPTNNILSRLKSVRQVAGGYVAKCPAHDDQQASLSVATGDDGRVLLHCHAGCSIEDVCRALGLSASDLFAQSGRRESSDRRRIEATYDYTDEEGNLLFQTIRYSPKGFSQRRPDDKGGWFYNLDGVRRVPYRLPELLSADQVLVPEGEKDVETLQAQGLAATCNPMGAGKWRAEYAPFFRGKAVVILPDNDAPGRSHAVAVGKSLKGVARSVKILDLPGLPPKGDVTDWIASGKTKTDLITLMDEATEWEEPSKSGDRAAGVPDPYFIDNDGYLCRWKERNGATISVRLANFNARIIEEIVEDNGLEQTHRFTVEGSAKEGDLPRTSITATQFPSMNWVFQSWGNRAILEAGQNTKDLVRHAIQVQSKQAQKKTVFTHTGWRQVNGVWAYLTAAGAIGADNILVTLPRTLERYGLPLAPKQELEAIEASLSFLDLGRHEITFPLYSLTWLAPLTALLAPMPNFSGYAYGDTGTFKTTLALLLLAHFGSFEQVGDLSNFEDTPNAVEKKAFTLKDVLLVLDDYHPSERRRDAQQKEMLAQRLIREYSNRTGRDRLNPDATDKGRYAPRGMLLITGEELVRLPSTLARTMVVELAKGDIDKDKLTALQSRTALLPHAMASYIWWVRDNIETVRQDFPAQFRALRERAACNGAHRKLPEQAAFLQFALETMLSWVVDRGTLDESRAKELSKEGWEIFNRLSAQQIQRIEDDEPIRRFCDIVETLLTQKRVKIEHKDGMLALTEDDDDAELIGYHDDQFTYLLPTPLWHEVQRYCAMEQAYFPLTRETLYRRLADKGLIHKEKGRHTVPVKIRGKTMRVLKFTGRGMLQDEVTEVTHE
jgi:hypothetical protein